SATTQNVILSDFNMYFIKESVGCGGYGVWNNLGSGAYFRINGVGCTGVANNAFVGNIGPSGSIYRYSDSTCTTSLDSITFAQAESVDGNGNGNCVVNFDRTDR
ncbi:MAG: hypothetical protein H6R39_111, partial [Deltaproteobacteria bacterium]|nr:hypothetical protein [Deltaproteobacteria bacterium]